MKLIIFNLGLIITSIALGFKLGQVDGWLTLGGGLMLEALIVGFLEYAKPGSTDTSMSN